ncbi:MAG: hypothetical protein AB1646_07975 [Thermodesulfobacteriota bacterium]
MDKKLGGSDSGPQKDDEPSALTPAPPERKINMNTAHLPQVEVPVKGYSFGRKLPGRRVPAQVPFSPRAANDILPSGESFTSRRIAQRVCRGELITVSLISTLLKIPSARVARMLDLGASPSWVWPDPQRGEPLFDPREFKPIHDAINWEPLTSASGA